MVAVAFAAVTKEYEPGEPVLSHLTLDVDDGTICCLIGPSGCGKSTALRVLAGLEEATGGQIRLGRRIVNDVPTRDRNLGMVTQDVALLPTAATRVSVAMPLDLRDTDPDERERRLALQVASLHLGELLDRRPAQLSGGEAQVAQIARAMIARPDVLLLDEPLARIDHTRRAAIRADLVRLQRVAGVTTLWVTADQADAMAVADRVAVLVDGRLVQVGPPMEVFGRPRTLAVARFVGEPEIGVLRGRVRGVAGDLWLDVAGIRLRLRVPRAVERLAGREVLAGIRPHDVAGLVEPVGPDAEAVTGTVVRTEPLGHAVVVTLEVPGEGGEVARLRWDRAPVGTRVGDRLQVLVDPERLHLFDPETEVAVHHPG